jgi:hypothetical protein
MGKPLYPRHTPRHIELSYSQSHPNGGTLLPVATMTLRLAGIQPVAFLGILSLTWDQIPDIVSRVNWGTASCANLLPKSQSQQS